MSESVNAPTVFVGGPFKGCIDPNTGLLLPEFRDRYIRLIEFFARNGWTVWNAHQEEGWGADMAADTNCTERDHRWMRECDLFVAFPGDPASPGTHVEIGWASAMGRPMVLVLEPGGRHAALVTGLYGVSPVVYLEYEQTPQFMPALAEAVAQVGQAARTWWANEPLAVPETV